MQRFSISAILVFLMLSNAKAAIATPAFDTTGLKIIILSFYCGECDGRCGDMYYVSPSSIIIDTSEYAYFGDGGNKAVAYIITKPEIKGYFNKLIEAYPATFELESKVYGKPDSYDQCGVYISYVFAGGRQVIINIDPDNQVSRDKTFLPKEIIAFRDSIMGVIKELRTKYAK